MGQIENIRRNAKSRELVSSDIASRDSASRDVASRELVSRELVSQDIAPKNERPKHEVVNADKPKRPRRGRSNMSREARARKKLVLSTIEAWRTFGVLAFAAILLIGFIGGTLVFMRPATSEVEKRELQKLPEISLESFLDGSYLSNFSLWYSDTYPMREQMVQANLGIDSLYGIKPETTMIGGNRVSDELPTDASLGEFKIESDSGEEVKDGRIDVPEARRQAQEMEGQISDGVYSDGSAAYTLYYFDKKATQNYVHLINDAAKLLDGKADVYSILLPTNGGVMLDDDVLKKLGVPNQEQAIDYFYGLMSPRVTTVPTFDTLYDHRDEYLYFRTDFHWTQLASYYVYESFCKTKGIEVSPYFDWEELVFDNYVGEYSGMVDTSGFEPDYVSARIPQGTNTVEYWTDDQNMSTSRVEGNVIQDLTGQKGNKYSCFVGGNRPLTHINNPEVTDGSSCLVIKDSFGNPFVSTLVDNYQDIYCIDFRYTHQKLVNLVEKYGIKDVIFENVIMFAGTNNCAKLLSSIIYPEGVTHNDLVDIWGPILQS